METARVEGRAPTVQDLRAYREQVRETYESLAWLESRLMRGVVPEAERDALVREWDAGNPETLVQVIGWRAQALREEEERLVERPDMRRAFDPLQLLDALTAAIDGDEPPTRYQIRDELAYVLRELRRAGSPTRVR